MFAPGRTQRPAQHPAHAHAFVFWRGVSASRFVIVPHALCVARHRFLSNHYGSFFGRYGLTSTCVVGIPAAIEAAESCSPSLVVCDYDVLAVVPLDEWESHGTLSQLPLVAVSMTRRPDEMHPLDVSGIAGFLYLPALKPEQIKRIIGSFTAGYASRVLDRSSSRLAVSPP
jgi:hypothetical protein